MKKNLSYWIATLMIASIAIPSAARSDVAVETHEETVHVDPAQEVVSPQEPYGDLAEVYEEEEDENVQGTEVSSTTNSQEKSKKKQFWTNIIIATVAVIVAVVSILVVSNNNGDSSS